VGAELFHADGRMDGWTDRRTDGQTNRLELDNSPIRNFAKAPKHEDIHLGPPIRPYQN
jgi:hypothetical protein